MSKDIWVIIRHRNGEFDDKSMSLINEAMTIKDSLSSETIVSAVVMGDGIRSCLTQFKAFGIDRVLYLESEGANDANIVMTWQMMAHLLLRNQPMFVLSVSSGENDDLMASLAAKSETPLVTRVIDYDISPQEEILVTRPIENGFLFQELELVQKPPYFLSFLPSVLSDARQTDESDVDIVDIPFTLDKTYANLEHIKTVEADPSELALEEADIIVAGGRGVGKGEQFDIIHRLAEALSGSVGGTRPIIDWHTLEFERQIGQTGKSVSPRLIVNCGISGANEYTAGMEKSQQVIVIDKNPKARMFKFADLGVVGDVHEIIPPLIEKIAEIKKIKAEAANNN